MSREFTKEEAREIFVGQIKMCISFWKNKEIDHEEKLHGLAFGIMSIFDGSSGFPCAIDLVLRPHEGDKAYRTEIGENYMKSGMVINDDCHLKTLIYSK